MQIIYNLSQIDEVASKLINDVHSKIFMFYGEMGVGKTTLIKSITKYLGVLDVVSSPTFSLVNEYKTQDGKTIFHFDFYRINSVNEALDMGVEEYFDSKAYVLIEWPEKIDQILPENAISVLLSYMEDGKRKLEIK